MERETFIFRKRWYEAIKDLDQETKVLAFEAICQYALLHTKIDIQNPMVKMAMAFIQPELENDYNKWQDERTKRSEAGKRGNEVRWGNKSQDVANIASATTGSQSIANIADNVFNVVNVNGSSCSALTRMTEEDEKKLIFKISKKMLRMGIPRSHQEAAKFVSFNKATGWKTASGKPIADPVEWASKWEAQGKQQNQNIANGAEPLITMMEAIGCTSKEVVDGFKGFRDTDAGVTMVTTKSGAAQFERCITKENCGTLRTAMQMYFKTTTLTYDY